MCAWQAESMEAHGWIKMGNKSWVTCTAVKAYSNIWELMLMPKIICYMFPWTRVSIIHSLPLQDKIDIHKVLISRSHFLLPCSRILPVHIQNKHVALVRARNFSTLSLLHLTSLYSFIFSFLERLNLGCVECLHLVRCTCVPSTPFNAWQGESTEAHVWIKLWNKSCVTRTVKVYSNASELVPMPKIICRHVQLNAALNSTEFAFTNASEALVRTQIWSPSSPIPPMQDKIDVSKSLSSPFFLFSSQLDSSSAHPKQSCGAHLSQNRPHT